MRQSGSGIILVLFYDYNPTNVIKNAMDRLCIKSSYNVGNKKPTMGTLCLKIRIVSDYNKIVGVNHLNPRQRKGGKGLLRNNFWLVPREYIRQKKTDLETEGRDCFE